MRKSYLERAHLIIERPSPARIQELVRECVLDGRAEALAAVRLLAEDMYGRITFNLELKAAATLGLLGFGEAGLNELQRMAIDSPESKNVSLTLNTLASVAAGSVPELATKFNSDETTGRIVLQNIKNPHVQEHARTLLREYIIGIEDDCDAVAAVGHQLATTRVLIGKQPVSDELIAALAARKLTIGPATIAKYRTLIETHSGIESALQGFLEEVPQLLDSAAVEVWSEPDLAGAQSPDFVVRRMDDSYLIVEIEVPTKPIITKNGQLSAQANHAVTQALGYRDFLVERTSLAQKHFPRFSYPDCLVVVGLESSLSAAQCAALQRENSSRHRLRIVGFDWLADRADAVFRNMISSTETRRSLRVF